MLPFDGEGRALGAQAWITKGVVSALATSRYWASKTGKSPIGGHGGFEVAPGSSERSALVAGVRRGVLISRFWYTNWVEAQNLLMTGLTRDGTFLIENGEIVGPVNNFRFNQSVAEAFAKCDALSNTLEAAHDAETVTPAMRTHEFLLASVSEAV
jgi:predicted Zn-dependent protease